MFIHGGPGGGCLPHHRRFYDPAFWRIVLYDQRGAGRSTPIADITDNTTRASRRRSRAPARSTSASIAGCCSAARGARRSRSRTRRRIPSACSGLVLRGIFLATRARDRLVHARHAQRLPGGLARVRGVPAARASAPICSRSYYRRLDRSRPRRPPARRACVGPLRGRVLDAAAPRRSRCAQPDDDAAALAIARIEAHYFVHDGFLARRRSSSRTSGASATCPARSSRAATTSSARRSPRTRWRARGRRRNTSSCPTPGHSVREPGITRELVAAVKRMQARLSRA